jgi:very-long-chain (3R)-3-hydroxyacyl-CoA dehydratase
MLTWKSNYDLLKSKNLYHNVEFFLLIFQTAAVLEVVHAAVGLVRSNPVLVLLQVLSRLIVVWLIMYVFETSRNCIGVLICCLAWSFAEITRYLYYALNILDKTAYVFTWCRYSLFIVLYPIGITGELICIYKAVEYLPPLRNRTKYSF